MKVEEEGLCPFDDEFLVENMENPKEFIPDVKLTQTEPGCYEGCLKCCGMGCQCLCLGLVCCSLGVCSCCASGIFYELPTANAGIVEEFGKFSRLLYPGLNLINPCTESVTEVSMKIQCLKTGRQTVQTKDNINLDIETVVFYRIVNPVLVNYVIGVQLVYQNIRELSVAVSRDTISNSTLEDILLRREVFSSRSLEIISGLTRRQGILVEQIYLTDISFSKEIERNLISMAKEKRVSQAKIILSKADVESASLMKEASQLLSSKAAMQIRYLELIESITSSKKNCKVIMPLTASFIQTG